ncbi:hypothetical protein scyTo_0008190 [Scyliorhinus torazame]|uniref:Uncharacterized protein n=1 Tax=Scyliorhinus torazame TaxID=75743 RepID=A0A401P502_SCYTO|nr:hypothetical protein [Scyliorhinus torazame]
MDYNSQEPQRAASIVPSPRPAIAPRGRGLQPATRLIGWSGRLSRKALIKQSCVKEYISSPKLWSPRQTQQLPVGDTPPHAYSSSAELWQELHSPPRCPGMVP